MKPPKKINIRLISFVILWIFLISFLLIGGIWFKNTLEKEQLTITANTVKKAAVQCYALEGFYPPSLDYLVSNYGFEYNDNYIVDYQYIGSNLMPEVFVIPKK